MASFGQHVACLALALGVGCGDDGVAFEQAETGSPTSTGNDDGTTGDAPGTTSDAGSSDGSADDGSDAADEGNDDTSADTGEAAGGNCCEAHDAPGCNEPQVQACVCQSDATCCVLLWDGVCASAAQDECASACLDDEEAGELCQDIGAFTFGVGGAELSGGWSLSESQVGEGTIAVNDNGVPGSVTFTAQIDCATTWHVWVRWFLPEVGADEFTVTVDGQPRPAAIFSGDCLGIGGGGWIWSRLNWQEEGASGCDFVQDPWALPWSAGDHTITFGYRSSSALARIILTNDPDYVPE